MAAARIAGTCFLKLDGQQYDLKGDLSVMPHSIKREGVAGMDGIHGFKETQVVPFIEGTVTLSPGLSVKALQGVSDSTVTAELSNGKVYVLRNAWFAGEPAIDGAEGQVPLRFEGLECLEVA